MLRRFFVIKTYYNVNGNCEKLKQPIFLTTQLFYTINDALSRKEFLLDNYVSELKFFDRYMKENNITEKEMRILLCHIEEIYRDDYMELS